MRRSVNPRPDKFHAFAPGVRAVQLLFGDANLIVAIGRVNGVAVHAEPDHAERELVPAYSGQGQGLFDGACCGFDKNEIVQVLNDEQFAVLGQGKIHGTSRKCHLLAHRFQDLVGGHHNPAVRLHSDFKTIEIIRPAGRMSSKDFDYQPARDNNQQPHEGFSVTRRHLGYLTRVNVAGLKGKWFFGEKSSRIAVRVGN